MKRSDIRLKKEYQDVLASLSDSLVTASDDLRTYYFNFPSFVRKGGAITLLIELPEDYPFHPPNVVAAGYNISVIDDWHPSTTLSKYIPTIVTDIRNAEQSSSFLDGNPYTGKHFVVQRKHSY